MSPTPTEIVAYLALFATVVFLFVLASLILGWFLRASVPTQQKLEAYECGEPAIGPGTVQFDLRFYVVALLFLIFEVEVAFFFPPATVFGTAIHVEKTSSAVKADSPILADTRIGTVPEQLPVASAASSHTLAKAAMIDLGLFFAVLLVGFAFVWRRGDLDWVRSVHHPATPAETAALVARLHGGDLPI
jgi:NADH-quinone oxidoreductase subunit A